MNNTEGEPGSDAKGGVAPVDVRVLGAGTSFRFALLVVLILSSSISMLRTIIPGAGDETDRYFNCALAAGFDLADPVPNDLRGSDALASCMSGHHYGVLPRTLLATGLMLALAFAIYLLHPAWKSRGGRLVPVDNLSSDELSDELQRLVETAGLSRAPRFVIDPVAATPSAVVFGRLRRYSVCLHGGLLARRATDPNGFRGVVLHELAHIRNRDVDVAYATVALGRAFLTVVLVPYLVVTVYAMLGQASSSALALRGVFRTTVLLTMIYLTRADILRTREIYADVDAAGWGAGPEGWRSPADRRHQTGRAVQAFLGLWRTHPRWVDRRKSLVDPSALFSVRALPLFLTGTAAMIATDQTATMLSTGQLGGFLSRGLRSALSDSTGWLMAALVTGIAGVALWRAVAHAVLTSRPVPSGVWPGLWLGAGLAAGELLTFRTAGLGWLPPQPAVVLVLVVGVVVLTWWVNQCAELWIRTSRGRSLRPIYLLGLVATFSVFGTWFAYWMSRAFVLMGGIPWSQSPESIWVAAGLSSTVSTVAMPALFTLLLPVVGALANNPLMFAGAGVLWLFPLAAWMRRPVTHVPPWVRSTLPHRQDREGPGEHLPALRRIVGAAAIGGALCCTAAALVMLGLHPLQPPSDERGATWVIVYVTWLALAIVASACVTAAFVSALVRRYRLVLALGAAGGALLIGLTGSFVLAATDGCVTPLAVMTSSCAWRPYAAWSLITALVPFVLGLGMYLAAIAALGGTIVARLAGQLAWRRQGRVEYRGNDERTTARPISVISMAPARAAMWPPRRRSIST